MSAASILRTPAAVLAPASSLLLRLEGKVGELDERLKSTKQRAQRHTLVRLTAALPSTRPWPLASLLHPIVYRRVGRMHTTAQILFLRGVRQFFVPNNLPSHSEFCRLLRRAFSYLLEILRKLLSSPRRSDCRSLSSVTFFLLKQEK